MHEARLKTDGDENYYRRAYAWHDPDADPNTKAAYRFIHHDVSDAGDIGPANVRACVTGIAVLNGARGGTTIPEGDRQTVYAHLAAHIRDSGAEPPELKSMKQIEKKFLDVPLEVKELNEDGTFEGYLSVYNFVDWGRDVVESGACKKTLKESDGKLPLCLHHDLKNQVGVLNCTDTEDSLVVKGVFNLDVQNARDAYSIMRFNKRQGLKTGLSMGFLTVKDEIKNGIRYIKELMLLEGSIVTLPMNRLCVVTDVKSAEALAAESKDFTAALESIQAWEMRQQFMQALAAAMDEAFYAGDMDRQERINAVRKAIADFQAAFTNALPAMFDARGIKQLQVPVTERGRDFVRSVVKTFSALLEDTASTSSEAAAVHPPEAAISTAEPAIPLARVESLLKSWKEQLRAV